MKKLQRLSSLRPLQENCKQSQSIQNAIKLLTKGITLSTTKEKNDLILSLQDLIPTIYNEYDEILNKNSEKNKELEKLNGLLEERKKDHYILQRNSDFYKLWKKHKNRHPLEQEYHKNIEIENEFLKYENIPENARFAERMKKKSQSEDILTFVYQDEAIKGLEMISYQLQKRLNIVEQSGDTFEDISAEFGSINGLLSQYNILHEENSLLKSDEFKYMNDPMAKRRKFVDLNTHSMRSVLESMEEAIKNEIDVADIYNVNNAIKEGVDIDKFGSNLVNSINHENCDYDSLEHLRNSIKESEESLDHIKSQRNTVHTTEQLSQTENSRVYKITETNNVCLSKVKAINDNIDVTIDEIDRLRKEMSDTLESRRNYLIIYHNELEQFKKLTELHTQLSYMNQKNLWISKTIASVTSSFGKDMYDPYENSPKTLLVDPIVKSAEENRILKKEKSEKLALSSTEENHPKRRYKHSKSRLQISSLYSSSDSVVSKEKINAQKLYNFDSKEEILNGMSISLELSGPIFGFSNNVHSKNKKLYDLISHGISQQAHESINSISKYLRENITKLRMLSNEILIKDKCDFALQTDPYKRSDVEIQTEENQKKAQHGKKK